MSQTTHPSGSSKISNPGNLIFDGNSTCLGGFHQWCRKTHWRITTTYVEKEWGICCPSIQNLELIRVKDIQYSGCTCCSYCGTITIWSSDETNPLLKIDGIPGMEEVFRKIRNAVDRLQGRAQIDIPST